ncbi:glycosyltransferase family 4 protein [Luteipulveratus sp. YIM 133132]|uniref:glycosyltransferase family 4 protein n=1 Tax=Luteipulveratus flavus TaxID=3031728 RepID=UPI0023B12103|nr:glycosyltransferase family 4 protein [Luteipulveratus sp. YIM 133132]MDE9364314.1 glycosyltransferase family 4 protein [Luteipulveratus sp. YIM 133132]
MTLRIVHVVCSDGFAGVERHIAVLAPELARLGCEVVVLGGDGSRMRATLDPAGVAWFPASSRGEAAGRLVRLGRPSLVHAHMTEAELVAVATRPVHRAPVVATRHFAAGRGSSAAARWVGRRIEGRLAGQLAISDYVARESGGATWTVHPGVPVQESRVPAAERDRTVLVVQRLEPEKSTRTAVDAWARSGLAEQGWRLRLAGEGSERASIEKDVADRGLGDTVELFGARDDVAELMRGAGILLAPTPREGLGLAVLEAMAAGLPVVASASGGHDETVGAVTPDSLFAPGDAETAGRLLRERASDLARRERDGDLLQRHQQAAFTVRRQAQETLRAYQQVLA